MNGLTGLGRVPGAAYLLASIQEFVSFDHALAGKEHCPGSSVLFTGGAGFEASAVRFNSGVDLALKRPTHCSSSVQSETPMVDVSAGCHPRAHRRNESLPCWVV